MNIRHVSIKIRPVGHELPGSPDTAVWSIVGNDRPETLIRLEALDEQGRGSAIPDAAARGTRFLKRLCCVLSPLAVNLVITWTPVEIFLLKRIKLAGELPFGFETWNEALGA